MTPLQSVPHLYYSSPDYPALTGREVRRTALLTELAEAWRAGHPILGLYGHRGMGKTLAAIQATTALSDNSPTRTLWVELRVCPNAGGLLSQLADCLQEMGQMDVAQALRQQARPMPTYVADILLQALGSNGLLIVDQCEAVLDAQGQMVDAYLRALLHALLHQTGWRGLLTVRTQDSTVPSTDLLTEGHTSPCRVRWFSAAEWSFQEREVLLRTWPHDPLRWNHLSADNRRLFLTQIARNPGLSPLFLAVPGDDPIVTAKEIQRRATSSNHTDAQAYECALLDYYLEQVPATSRPMLELLAVLEDREPWPFLEGAWKAVGSILGWPARQASGALADLTRRALVEKGDEGYRIVPMVRQHLLSHPPPLGLAESLSRLFHYHLARLYEALAKQVKEQARGLLASAGSYESPQVAALIRYHAVLRDRALRQALRRNTPRLVRRALDGLVEPSPWRLTTQLAASRCLAYAQRLNALVQETVSQPGEEHQPAEIGACYQTIGLVCHEIGEEQQAIQAYQNALAWWEQTRQLHRMGSAWVEIGKVHAQQQRWSEALTAYRTALDWWERTRQYPKMGETWHQIGKLYNVQGKWLDALTAYHTALDWQGRTNRQAESGNTWRRIGEVHERQVEIGRAAQAYTKALELLRAHNMGVHALDPICIAATRLLAAHSATFGKDVADDLAQLRGMMQSLRSK